MAKREDYFEITPPVDEKEVQNPFDGKNSEQKKEEAREEKSEGEMCIRDRPRTAHTWALLWRFHGNQPP